MTHRGNRFLFNLSLFIIFSGAISLLSIWTRDNKGLLLRSGCECFDFSGEIDYSDSTAIFEGNQIELPKTAFENLPANVLAATSEEKWIEVDLSEQKLKAWQGGVLFLETAISTGLPLTPTPKGEFRIWIKLRATKMSGGRGRNYYYLPNVPYVMFFSNNKIPSWKGYGLHGTYWHNDFGRPRSHGCVNLPTEIAAKIYYWATPALSEGKSSIRATNENPGTKIVIHD